MFDLVVVTPEQKIYQASDVKMIVVPATTGEMGILQNHHPIVSQLNIGRVRIIKEDDSEEVIFLSGGYLEFSNNRATILAEVAENVDQIALDQVRQAREKAQQLLKTATSDVEIERLKNELKTQLMRERLAHLSQFRKKRQD